MCVVVISLVACSDPVDGQSDHSGRRSNDPTPTETSEPAYRVIEVTESGTIRGNLRWQGDVPEPHRIDVLTHRDSCGASQVARTLVISDGGGVADAVVSIDIRRGAARATPESPPMLDNVGCRFEPHVMAVGLGALIFRNSDDVLHNVHAFSDDDTVVDLGLPQRGAQVERVIDAPGTLRVVCDAGHGWQMAWIHAFEHPYFSVTDERGQFEIADVPPGLYTLRVWHEGWRVVGRRAGRPRWSSPVVLSRSVTVSTEHETTVDFELSAHSAEIAGD